MSEKITRREALKTMAAAGAGVVVAGTMLESCSSSSSKGATVAKEAPEGTKVSTREWPSLGASISMLGLGCMRLPTVPSELQWGAPLDQDKCNDMFKYALDHGINYFDTAPAYGESEKATGKALVASGYPRESYMIATKMSNFAFGPNAKSTLEGAQAMFENSLANLQTDYVDFMLLHSLGDEAGFQSRFIENGVLDYLFKMKEEGKIRHMGFSYHGPDAYLEELLAKPYKWEFVQIQMNYADWKEIPGDGDAKSGKKATAMGQYKILADKGIPVVVMEPVKGGALANVSDALKARLAEKHPTLSPAGCALSFVSSHPGVAVTLSGMSNMEQLKENIALYTDFKAFSDAEIAHMNEMADLYNSNIHIPCTACAYCMPCPNGVNIPGNFKVFNTTSDELNIPDPNNQDKDYKKKRKILLARYNKDLADGTRADACTKCNVCLPKCPQHIRIPDQLKMVQDLIDKLG